MNNKAGFVRYKKLEAFEKLISFTTTKHSFLEKNKRFTGIDLSDLIKNRKLLAGKLGIDYKQLVFPQQTHTNHVADVFNIPECDINETDAFVSNKTGICLCIQTADCVPVLLYDPVENVVAAIHAGWRGTVKKITQMAVQKMINNYNSSPKNILVAIGPSISPGVYEVGNEVVSAVKESVPNADLTLHKNEAGKFHFNLWEANRQILLENQIRQNNIEITGECSFTLEDKYFSARREGIDTGRMVTGIMLI